MLNAERRSDATQSRKSAPVTFSKPRQLCMSGKPAGAKAGTLTRFGGFLFEYGPCLLRRQRCYAGVFIFGTIIPILGTTNLRRIAFAGLTGRRLLGVAALNVNMMPKRHTMSKDSAMSDPTSPADLPFWQMIIFAVLCGLAGELYRADLAGVSRMEMVRRAVIRSGASIAGGVCALLICLHLEFSVYLAGAMTGLASLAGAEIVIAVYVAWLQRKAGQ